MPQFETTAFIGQIFWMFISFGFLYLMMSQLVCPMIEEVLSAREGQIQADLARAEHMNREAEALHQRHQAYLLSAEKEKMERIRAAYAKIQKTTAAHEARHDSQLRRKIQRTEQKIETATMALRQESEEISAQLAQKLVKHLTTQGDKA